MSDEAVRKEFEAWAGNPATPAGKSAYEYMWEAWKAARSAAIQECADIAFKADTNWDAREQILALKER